VSRTELATLFWGERGEERARQSLRQALLELKQALGDRVDVDPESVRLAPDAIELDLTGFERDVAEGRLAEAAARWTGDFFEGADDIGGDGFRRWIESERVALHRQLGVAMEKLIGDAELRGDWTGAAGWAERWAGALPFDERAHLRLIEALRMSGRSAEALKTHAAFVSRVRAALDVEPSAEFLRLGGGLADDARSELARRGRGSAAVHAPQLAGRNAVMTELLDAWSMTVAGTPQVVLLRGEAGAGVTRVADELVERIAAEAVVLRAREASDRPALAETLGPVRQAPGLAGASPDALAEVAQWVPALSSRFPHLPPPAGGDGPLRDGIGQILVAISEERPVLLLLDDAHATDDLSRRLLLALAPRQTGRVMLLFTEDEGAGASVGTALTGVRGLRRIQLEPLSVAETETMVGSMVTLEPGDRRILAQRLHEESAGLPRDVNHLVTALVEEHLLIPDEAGVWRMSPVLAGRPLPLPVAARERTGVKFEQLPAPARAMAEAMAVLGAPTAPGVMAAVGEVTPDEAEDALGELLRRRVIRESSGPGRYEFTAPLLARAAAALLPPTRRQELHARAARVLAERDLASTAERSLLPYHVARAAPATPAPLSPAAPPVTRTGRPRMWLAMAGAAILALVLLLPRLGVGRGGSAPSEEIPILVIGRIADYRPDAAADLTRPLTDMLSTNLGRVRRLRVVSTARVYELMYQQAAEGGDTSATAIVAAARRAGATELIDGALYARDDGGLRLDLRRVELASGNIRQTHSVTGGSIFELADSGTARLAADLGETTPLGSIAEVTTRSLSAYRLYEQGLRAYYANDPREAIPLFEAALAEDSTFAMAAYYSALSLAGQPDVALDRYLLAERLAGRTTDRERLTILARLAFVSSSPSLGALADTLLVRYPDEVEGYYFTGLSRLVEGEFLRGLPALNRAVAMDSLELAGSGARCDACDALRQIVSIYQHADSLPAAERETRRWIRLQPRSAYAWQLLSDVLAQSGRATEAAAALEQAAALDAGRREAERVTDRALLHIYAGQYDDADRLLTGEIESGGPFRSVVSYWYRSITRRQQGRLEEALADARQHRTLASARYPRLPAARRAAPQEALNQAEILFEMGRFRPSAALFDSVSRWGLPRESASQHAHARLWALTHASRALAAAGDTSELSARADTIQRLGTISGSGRDRLLHHYVRGLLLVARGQDEAAVTELRRAMWSWSFGYTRVNQALADALLRLGRPRDAIALLQPALRGTIEASNFYFPRTEIHELLGHAWRAVGDRPGRDSAAAHYAMVEQAWQRADPTFAQRLALVRRRLGELRQ
jgi:DNA-binding SARP family transcriptional activator